MMKSLLKRVVFGSMTLGILATSFSVLAMPPHYPNAHDGGNVWWLNAYDDSGKHQWVESRAICFGPWSSLDMHAEYEYWIDVWPSIFLGVAGARQEGDQILMVGNGYSPDEDSRWHTSRQWEITSQDKGYGHLQSWHQTTGEHKWYNIELERLPFMCDCHGLASYLSTVDTHIDNADTFERLLLTPEVENVCEKAK